MNKQTTQQVHHRKMVACLEHPQQPLSLVEKQALAELLSNDIVKRYLRSLQADAVNTKMGLAATVMEMSDAEYRNRHATLDGQIDVLETLHSIENPREDADPA